MSHTSTAAVAVSYGGPESLRLIDVDPGEPGPGEVLIDVRAAAVNPYDWKQYAGGPGADPARLPLRLGFEVAGVVTDIGPHVRWLAVGDEVVAWPVHGGYARSLVVPEQVTVRKPATLGWPQAAGLLVAGTTAEHALTATRTGPQDVVLVHGGSGSVGRMALQLAELRGARVIATASPAAHDDLRALGAVPVTYGAGLVDRVRAAAHDLGADVTVAIDTVGSDEALDTSVALVADRTRIATIAGFRRAGELGILALGGAPGADPGTQVRDAARAQLVELAGDGTLDVHVARTYPLSDVAQAHADSRSGHARGKLVLLP
ncbi:quinone oxidoreductase family protein [Cellulomonas persica]|uniref:Putative oxidoreductase n=1 Tax=Cellulomonas persica TaxID=76861 RepID=A0A510UV12_9CELL|nr:NADP-dependent oxidoreductase [Cellulomonas persica]GEK18524.1 putative oxidoreductase [Cellulomonas persica]